MIASRTTFTALIFLVGCACVDPRQAKDLSERRRKEIESAVINRFNAMIKYCEAGEVDNFLMHFDPDGEGTYFDAGVRFPTFQDMAVIYRATWKVKKQDYGVPDTKVYILSENAALVTSSSLALSTVARDGTVFQPRPWTITTLWILKDSVWMIHSFHQFEGELKPLEETKP